MGLIVLAVPASSSDALPREYQVQHRTTGDGLPQTKVQAVLQTQDGYLWVGTVEGLARFDGRKFKVFDRHNTPEMPSDAVKTLAQASDGTLWITTTDGLVWLKDGVFHRYTTADGLPHRKVWQLCLTRDTGIWFNADNSLARFHNGQFRSYSTADGLRMIRPRCLQVSPDGFLVVGVEPGMQRYDRETDRFVDYAPMGFPGDWGVNGIEFGPSGELWVATDKGLYRLKNNQWRRYAMEDGLLEEGVLHVHQNRLGDVWVAAWHTGLHRFDGRRFIPFDLGISEGKGAINCLYSDLENNLWVGTGEGLFQIRRPLFDTYNAFHDGLVSDHVHTVCEGKDGSIWAGSAQGLTKIRVGAGLANYSDGWLHDFGVKAVWPDAEGSVWLAANIVYNFKEHPNMKGPAMRIEGAPPWGEWGGLYEDRDGYLWAGSTAGVFRFKDGQYTHFTKKDGLDGGGDSFLQTRSGDFWVSNGSGLYRFLDGKFTRLIVNGMSFHTASLYEDAEGIIWFGTQSGLARMRDEQVFLFTTNHGLPENHIRCLLEDELGNFWFGGLRGIYRAPRSEFNDLAEGRTNEIHCVVYGEADGLLSTEVNGKRQPAAWKARDGRLWFPMAKGLSVVDPKRAHANETPPSVIVQQVVADREIIYGDGSSRRKEALTSPVPSIDVRASSPRLLRLGPGRARVLTLHFTANTFVAPDRVRFQYRLEGEHEDWRDDDGSRVAHYTNLRPGEYRFHVKACNSHSSWSEPNAAFAFSLAPHFCETWPFYTVCGLAVIGAAAGIQYSRLRGLRKILALQQQHALELERARIAQDMHDDLGSSLTRIAILSEVAKQSLSDPKAAESQVAHISSMARTAVENIKEIVWAVTPRNDTLDSLCAYLREYAAKQFEIASIHYHLDFPSAIPAQPITAEHRRNLFLAVKEALHNILKHSGATRSEVRLELKRSEAETQNPKLADGKTAPLNGVSCVEVRISDNGQGFDPASAVSSGNGLPNMRQRVERIGGVFEIRSRKGEGTTVVLKVNL